MPGEDLGYKLGVVEKDKFEYSPLGEVFNKVLKKDDKGNKFNNYNNELMHSSLHNLNKYNVSHFNEISSVGSTFDSQKIFYKDF